jgi:OOP family OmpA-OmpF porin
MNKLLVLILMAWMFAGSTAIAAADSDFDGVPDDIDQCPNTLRTVYANEFGCAPDSDKDGIPDAVDKCPWTKAGLEIDERGCAVDKDEDGVLNYLDMCHGTKLGTKINAAGCAISQVVILGGVTFKSSSAQLIGDSSSILDETVKQLKAHADLQVVVAGYTDNRGKESLNKRLSQQRAEAVMKYLVNGGIKSSRLTAKGYGPADPVASNNTAEGRAANRRVELHILE